MAHFTPACSISRTAAGRDEDDTFGWHLFHDRQRNLVYYLHSYTGEVRWPRPETVGFVMHGLKPLPASAGVDASTDSLANPDIWSPFYPHVVMLPSGLVQVHPGPESTSKGTTEMWCGYNRFPLSSVAVEKALSEQHKTKGIIDRVALLGSTEPRILPPTWEEQRSGSPFLPPYPVAILKNDDAKDIPKAAPSFFHRLDERFRTLAVDGPHRYFHLQDGDLGRVHGSLNWTTVTSRGTTRETLVSKPQPACSNGIPAPNPEKKEHNRKGYLLRQARKMMRASGATTTVAASMSLSKQRQDQDTAALKHERSLDNDQPNCINICRLTSLQTRENITVPTAGSVKNHRRPKPKVSTDKFAALSMAFFDRVQIAMEPLQPPINDEFQLQRDDGELVIGINAQEFKIKVLSSKQQIELLSPVSGLRTYHWNAMTKRWEDVADSHDIEGLLTRDLMRFCAGIPLF